MKTMNGTGVGWKVVAVLGGVGLGVWILAPELFRLALPLLLLAACPLAMLFMMRGMHAQPSASEGEMMSASGSNGSESSAELRSRLARLQAEQEGLARQLSELEPGPSSGSPRTPAESAGGRARG